MEPRDTWSMERLEDLAPYPHIWKSPEEELAILSAASTGGTRLSPRLSRTAIHLEFELGHTSRADTLAQLYHDPATALRERLLAELAFARGEDTVGLAHYFQGALAIADTVEAAGYRGDLVWIAEPEELREWDQLSNSSDAREKWLRGFWGRRDLADARPPGTRLPEHFRRWRLALTSYRWERDGSTVLGLDIPPAAANQATLGDILFPRSPKHTVMDLQNSFIPRSRVLDDRGRLTMRLGAPEAVNLPGISASSEANLFWLTPNGRVVVGFSKPSVPRDLNRAGLDRYGMIARNYPTGDLTTTCVVDAKLCVLAGFLALVPRGGRSAAAEDLAGATVTRYSGMRVFAERADLNPEVFRDSLGATVQAYGVLGGGVLVVIGIPLDRLLRSVTTEQAAPSRLAAHVRVIIGNSVLGEIVTVLDTLRTWRGPANPIPGSLISSYLLVPAPPGSWRVAVVVSDEKREYGTGVQFNAVPIAGKGSGRVVISDPIFGRTGGGLSWRHNDELVPLNPTNAWRSDEAVLISYEVDGLVPGRMYETRYETWKTAGRPKSPSNVITMRAAASAVTETVHRELSLRELSQGDYRVVIRVKDTVTKVESVRERMIPVRK